MKHSTSSIYRRCATVLLAAALWSTSANIPAALLAAGGASTFTIAFDRAPFALMLGGSLEAPGVFHSHFYDSAASDYLSRSGADLLAAGGTQEQQASNLQHEITPVGANPPGQAANRHVQATSADFSVDSDSLSGTGVLGLAGVQKLSVGTGVWAGASLVYGDYAIRYDPSARQSVWDVNGVGATANGWFLENHIYAIVMAVYDFANLSLTVADANNWQLRGDLLISPENAYMLTGATRVDDVGDFCLGVGSYAGCGAAPVPVPAAAWLFVGGLAGLMRSLTARSPISKRAC